MGSFLSSSQIIEFEGLLSNYQPNNKTKEVFEQLRIGAIVGPAGSGKDTLRNELIEKYPETYSLLLSTTSRPQRSGEVEGKDYHFSDTEAMKQSFENGDFLQGKVVHNQQISGLHISALENVNHKIALAILVTETEAELRAKKKDIKTIFLVPPSYEVWMNRLQKGRSFNEAELIRRMTSAKEEISYALTQSHYYFMITDTIESALMHSHEFFGHSKIDSSLNERARTVARETLRFL